MSKAVLISIRKEHNANIFFHKVKRWEGRKILPSNVPVKDYLDPTTTYNKSDDDVTFYVYEPKSDGGCGKVIGEFKCDFAQSFRHGVTKEICEALVVSKEFARSYFHKGKGYIIRINEPKRYGQPKELSEFLKPCIYGEGNEQCTLCDKSGYNAEMCLTCYNNVTSPPQSWQYVEELKYGCTPKENVDHASKVICTMKQYKEANEKRKKGVACYLDGYKIAYFESIREAERITGIHSSNIVACLKGRQKTAKGYTWCYVEEI